jgi:hypothetical protein
MTCVCRRAVKTYVLPSFLMVLRNSGSAPADGIGFQIDASQVCRWEALRQGLNLDITSILVSCGPAACMVCAIYMQQGRNLSLHPIPPPAPHPYTPFFFAVTALILVTPCTSFARFLLLYFLVQ